MFVAVRPQQARFRPYVLGRRFAMAESDDLQKQLHSIGDEAEAKVARSFTNDVRSTKQDIDQSALADMIAAKNDAAALTESKVETLNAKFSDSITPTIAAATRASASAAFDASPVASVGYSFNLVNTQAVAWAREHSSQFLTGVSDRSTNAIRHVIATALSDGMDPNEASRLIGDVLGLTEQNAKSVLKYRQGLVDAGLATPRIETLVRRYTNKLLSARGENIARTETMAAANEGARLLWQDLFNQDLLNNNEWERKWMVAPDERVCPLCRPLHGKTAPVDGVFESGLRNPPRHNRCRCTHVLDRREVPVAPKVHEIVREGPEDIRDLVAPTVELQDEIVRGNDRVLQAIAQERGFTGKPHVVDQGTLDEYVARGEVELFRGITDRKLAEQYITGDYFAGTGIFGNGTYTVTHGRRDPVELATTYAGMRGAVLRMTLKSDARVISYEDLMAERSEFQEAQKARARLRLPDDDPDVEAARRWNLKDPGRYAAAKGYDAIYVSEADYYVVLNRTATRVQSTFAKDLGAAERAERLAKAEKRRTEQLGILDGYPDGDIKRDMQKVIEDKYRDDVAKIEADYGQ